ncbi:MAG: serine hydrolase domain-containing protein [Ferruginibacter sp.]
MNKLIAILFSILVAGFACEGQTINTGKIDSLLNALESQHLVMGSLAISKSSIMQYQKAMGYSYIASGKQIPANIKSKYRIGSATKMFTAVVILQLMEEGKIYPDQKLSVYFPNLPNANTININDLLYHRSGLHDYTHDTNFPEWMDQPKTHEELLKIIKEKGADFEPGTTADYSNSNYLVLGYIIEKICKMPYSDAIRKRIISKLDLEDTNYGNAINIKNNESSSYKYFNNAWTSVKETALSIHGGAGSLVSTATDLVKFMNALFSYKLVNKSSLVKMETMIDEYGMGMFSNKYGSALSYGHNGRIEEFYSAVWYFPKEKLCFAYCSNGLAYPRTDLIEGILKICFNEPFTLPFFETIDLKSSDLEKYPGTYSSENIVVNCTKEGNKILVETKGKVFELKAIGDNYFMHAQTGYFFEFNPDKGLLLIKETDNVYHLQKQP